MKSVLRYHVKQNMYSNYLNVCTGTYTSLYTNKTDYIIAVCVLQTEVHE